VSHQERGRLALGGRIDRSQPLSFRFNGRRYQGYAGDTLASALLAAGVTLVGRSLKFHRPRGIISAGVEEPGALVRLGRGAAAVPAAIPATVPLSPGLEAWPVNAWPGLGLDLLALADRLAPLLPPGFYYKTFLQPRHWWPFYERLLRRAGGLGRVELGQTEDASSSYDSRWLTVEVVVIGAGPAGLAAALAAGRRGARVLVVEQGPHAGGSLLGDGGPTAASVNGVPADSWHQAALAELAELPQITLLTRTTAFGHYDHQFLTLLEQRGPGVTTTVTVGRRERLWRVRARQVVLASGALEQPLVFANNDRPGVMLADAVRTYLHRYAVVPGRRVLVATNHDGAYRTALDLAAAGVTVVGIADLRPEATGALPEQARAAGLTVWPGHGIAAVTGGRRVRGVTLAPLAADGIGFERPRLRLGVDLLAHSGGWSPALQLLGHARGRLAWDPPAAAFLARELPPGWHLAGAVSGRHGLDQALTQGFAAGAAAAEAAGFTQGLRRGTPEAGPALDARPGSPALLPAGPRGGKRFVDLQSDVTVADVELAVREGYRSIEHVKRYTGAGMGIDQGKTALLSTATSAATARGETLATVGLPRFRPPYTPVTLGALAGLRRGRLLAPEQRTPIDDWHATHGAVFAPFGRWRRPDHYRQPGESRAQAVAREVLAVRRAVGLFDSSTLGKIELIGPDAATLLERLTTGAWAGLPVGRARYALLLREDGTLFDDGVTARLGPEHFLVSTTTGHAEAVYQWLCEWHQCEWPDLKLQIVPATSQWAGVTLAGPDARVVLQRLLSAAGSSLDLGAAAFPPLAVRETRLGPVPARLLRVSFSGELSYEINVPARYGLALWQALVAAGEPEGLTPVGEAVEVTPVGVEAILVLRVEKGFIAVGHDTDGGATPEDLGLSALVKWAKGDFVGRRSLRLSHTSGVGRYQLVGLLPDDPQLVPPVGTGIAENGRPRPQPPLTFIGSVTSPVFSPTLGRSLALARVKDGALRLGERVLLDLPQQIARATLTSPRFYDPEGSRLDV